MYRFLAPGMLALALAAPLAAKNIYIPVAGVAQGANNTWFRTDVRIFNPSATTEIGISIHFQPAGQDGSQVPGRIVKVGPRKMVVLNDIVSFLAYPAPAIGAIRLDSDAGRSYEFVADSRTYTDSPNPLAAGTFGQFIPAMDPANALRKTVVQHLAHSPDITVGFRTNAGAMNPNLDPAHVTPRLYSADGVLIGEGPAFTVPPRSVRHMPLPAMVGRETIELTDGYLLLESDVPVFGYGSVVDNRSGDQIFIPGAEDRAD